MQIYYFSRTGRSAAIAQAIATAQGEAAHAITDDQNWSGALNYVKGGYMSSTKKEVSVTHTPIAPQGSIVLVFPIWAGGFPPAVRSFLNQVERSRVTLIPTSLISTLKDREGFDHIYDLVGKEITAPATLL